MEWYYGITYENVAWIVTRCKICNSNSKAADKAPITPIVSRGPGHRIYLDLVDFRAMPDEKMQWLANIRDHFSRKAWLVATEDKESTTIAGVLEKWIAQNGRGNIYRL